MWRNIDAFFGVSWIEIHSSDLVLNHWWLKDGKVLSLVPSLICWHIWKARNSFIHDGKTSSSSKLVVEILSTLELLRKAKNFSLPTRLLNFCNKPPMVVNEITLLASYCAQHQWHIKRKSKLSY